MRLYFPSALGCERLKPLRGQRVNHGFRQPFGSRRLLAEIFNLAHRVTLCGDNCLAPQVLQFRPMQRLLCELGHAGAIFEAASMTRR